MYSHNWSPSIYSDKRRTKEYSATIVNGGQYAEVKRQRHGWVNEAINTASTTRSNVDGLSISS